MELRADAGARRTRVAVVIPALDEEEALPLVLAEVPRELVELVVVVDNGSRDRTADVARACGAHVVSEPRRGYGQACLTGLDALFGTSANSNDRVSPPLEPDDVVVFLDGDHSDHPEELRLLLAPLQSDAADFVLGSRVLGGADMRAMLPQAWFGNRFACWLMRVLFDARFTDLGPFRAIRVGALQHLRMRDRTFGWTIEMQLKAHSARLRIVEVPVRYRARVGRSKITGTWSGTFHAGRKILGWILGYRFTSLSASRGIPRYR